MAEVRIIYHQEGDSWWAESPDLDGFTAGGASLREVRQMAREGAEFYLDASAEIREVLPNGGLVVQSQVRVPTYTAAPLRASAPFSTGGSAVTFQPSVAPVFA